MIYKTHYTSPIGEILLAGKDNKLIGLWFEDQKYYLHGFHEKMLENDQYAVFLKTKDWLDKYFKGENPNIHDLEMEPIGSDFRKAVWKCLIEISYGQVITYSDIAKEIAKQKGIQSVCAQAVGGAVGHNPISIIIPCHRVVGKNGSLTGYAGGLKRKSYLLKLEHVDVETLFKE
ncbi:MAG: methylated-DNA--[protein]-cysteine S-methyltransferase [Bacilli bacterium]|nr:methylated-DNA--[protein]-cysteine S-methyltransferase [Bacilli bacterium]